MFAAPFSYTLRGMTKLMEWRAPAEPDSAAGILPEHGFRQNHWIYENLCQTQFLCPSIASIVEPGCPSDTDVLKISSLPKRGTLWNLIVPALG